MSNLEQLFNELDSQDVLKRENYVRAPFSYAGGKSRQLSKILPQLPYRDSYIEPFGGSGAVLLARRPSPLEVFNDMYAGVVALYRCLHDSKLTKALSDRLSILIHSREEFIWCRDSWQNCGDTVERAARWYYMVLTSFGSLGRNFGRSTYSKQQTSHKIANHVKDFYKLHERIKNVLIENQDFRRMLTDFDHPDAVFYLDPPYLNAYAGIYMYELSLDDHREMLDIVFDMDAFVAVSGYENDLYNQYNWDEKYTWESHISIKAHAFRDENGKSGHVYDDTDLKAVEVLWIKH